jgi:hypothetical protein
MFRSSVFPNSTNNKVSISLYYIDIQTDDLSELIAVNLEINFRDCKPGEFWE